MSTLLPEQRELNPQEKGNLAALHHAARVVGGIVAVLESSAKTVSEKIDAVPDAQKRDVVRGQAYDAEECLERGRELLREGFIMLEQSIRRRPDGI